jgi:hypothetical protein
METYIPRVYYEKVHDPRPLYFDDFKIDYRGFTVGKDHNHQLYFIDCPEGKALPPELSGRFTKMSLLETAVDTWLSRHEKGQAELPNPPPPKKPHRKTRFIIRDGQTEEIEVEDIEDSNSLS